MNKLNPGAIFWESLLITNSTRLTNVIAKGEVAANSVKPERLQELGFDELPVEKFEQDIRDRYRDILVVLA